MRGGGGGTEGTPGASVTLLVALIRVGPRWSSASSLVAHRRPMHKGEELRWVVFG